jgi:5-hydroxyisourate hydrolase
MIEILSASQSLGNSADKTFLLDLKDHRKAHIMGRLTTHVLDTMNGCPAAGMVVALYRLDGEAAELLKSLVLNHDGRADKPLLEGETLQAGRYRLVFEVAAYFRSRGVNLPDPPFFDSVPLDFGLADTESHYHVPLLASPWAYSTYRGS